MRKRAKLVWEASTYFSFLIVARLTKIAPSTFTWRRKGNRGLLAVSLKCPTNFLMVICCIKVHLLLSSNNRISGTFNKSKYLPQACSKENWVSMAHLSQPRTTLQLWLRKIRGTFISQRRRHAGLKEVALTHVMYEWDRGLDLTILALRLGMQCTSLLSVTTIQTKTKLLF